MNEWNTVTL